MKRKEETKRKNSEVSLRRLTNNGESTTPDENKKKIHAL